MKSMDLNELLYAHQIAVISANARHTSTKARQDHVDEAVTYAAMIRSVPGSLDVSGCVLPKTIKRQAGGSAGRQDGLSSRQPDTCPLASWEGEGGTVV